MVNIEMLEPGKKRQSLQLTRVFVYTRDVRIASLGQVIGGADTKGTAKNISLVL